MAREISQIIKTNTFTVITKRMQN